MLPATAAYGDDYCDADVDADADAAVVVADDDGDDDDDDHVVVADDDPVATDIASRLQFDCNDGATKLQRNRNEIATKPPSPLTPFFLRKTVRSRRIPKFP